MRKLIFISLMLIIHQITEAQSVGINNTGMPPESCAMLDISSSSKGTVVPVLRIYERLAIVNPVLYCFM
jgi:hypothetical protein